MTTTATIPVRLFHDKKQKARKFPSELMGDAWKDTVVGVLSELKDKNWHCEYNDGTWIESGEDWELAAEFFKQELSSKPGQRLDLLVVVVEDVACSRCEGCNCCGQKSFFREGPYIAPGTIVQDGSTASDASSSSQKRALPPPLTDEEHEKMNTQIETPSELKEEEAAVLATAVGGAGAGGPPAKKFKIAGGYEINQNYTPSNMSSFSGATPQAVGMGAMGGGMGTMAGAMGGMGAMGGGMGGGMGNMGMMNQNLMAQGNNFSNMSRKQVNDMKNENMGQGVLAILQRQGQPMNTLWIRKNLPGPEKPKVKTVDWICHSLAEKGLVKVSDQIGPKNSRMWELIGAGGQSSGGADPGQMAQMMQMQQMQQMQQNQFGGGGGGGGAKRGGWRGGGGGGGRGRGRGRGGRRGRGRGGRGRGRGGGGGGNRGTRGMWY